MATRTAAPAADSGGGFDVGKWIERAFGVALIASVLYLIATIGLSGTLSFLDPQGTGSMLERLPRAVRNLGFLAFCIGFMVAVGEAVLGGPKHGRRLAVVGALTALTMIGAPSAYAWLIAHGGEVLTAGLNMAWKLLLALLQSLAKGLHS